MKMSNDFKQIIALLLANNVRFNLDYGIESYFLTKNNENGLHIWEIDDKNKDNGYKIIFGIKNITIRLFIFSLIMLLTLAPKKNNIIKGK